MNYFLDWHDHAASQAEKFYKTTLWQGQHLMLGLNCLEPGQAQPLHAHAGADKFYFVLEGRATFSIGEDEKELGSGMLAVAPAGISHGVKNISNERVSLLVSIAPFK